MQILMISFNERGKNLSTLGTGKNKVNNIQTEL